MRPGPHHIGTTGATDGDALVYDADIDEYGPGAVVTGLTSADSSVTITDNGDGTLDLAATTTTHLVPLTTVVGGVPQLVWDADNQLVLTEVS